MKRLGIIILINLFYIEGFCQGEDSINVRLEYQRVLVQSSSFLNVDVVDHLSLSSNTLDNEIVERINTVLRLSFELNLSHYFVKDIEDLMKQEGWIEINSLDTSYFDQILLEKARFISKVSSMPVDKVINSELITPELSPIKKEWDQDSICIDTLCLWYPQDHRELKCGYQLIQDSILVIELWNSDESGRSLYKHSFLFNLNTGYTIGFYDLFKKEKLAAIRAILHNSMQYNSHINNLIDGSEYARIDGFGEFPHFYLNQLEHQILVYGTSVHSMYAYDFGSHSFNTSISGYPIGFAQLRQLLKPWVIDYLEGK